MATLTKDKYRVLENTGVHPSYNEHPAVADDIIYGGAAVTLNASGEARPLTVADTANGFAGFCDEHCDNAGGAAGAKRVKVKEMGRVKLAVVGASSAANVNDPVYATDDDTFTLTASGALQIGKVGRWVSGTTCMVDFEATHRRSI